MLIVTDEDRWMAERHAATTAHMVAQLIAMGRTDLLPIDLRPDSSPS